MKKFSVMVYAPEAKATEIRNLDWPAHYDVNMANPKYFERPVTTLDGIWTNNEAIEKAYAKIGISVVALPGEKRVAKFADDDEPSQEASVSDQTEATSEESSDDEDEALSAPLDEDFSSTFAAQDESSDEESEGLPEGWRDLPWPKLRALANQHSEDSVKNKDDAVATLEAVEKGE